MNRQSKEKSIFKVPRRKHKPQKRKATPYHPKVLKKAANLMQTVLFPSETDPDLSSSSHPAKQNRVEFSKPESLPQEKKHTPLKRKPTPYHSKVLNKPTNLMQTVLFPSETDRKVPSSSKPAKQKRVEFSEPESLPREKIRRKSTPYHLAQKPCNDSVKDSLKTVLFPVINLDDESDEDKQINKFEVSYQYVSPSASLSELPERYRSTSSTPPSRAILVQNGESKSSSSSKMDICELECDTLDFTFNTNVSLISDDDDDSNQSDILYISNTNCENSLIFNDMELSCNTALQPESLQEEELQNGESMEGDTCSVPANDLDNDSSDAEAVSNESEADEENLNNTINEYSALKVNMKSRANTIEEPTFFSFDIKNNKFVMLQNNSKVHLHGLVSVRVLHGSVDILGYTLTPASGTKNIYSPKASPFLCFKTKEYNARKHDQTLIDFYNDELEAREHLANLPTNCCIMLLKQLENVAINFMEKHISQYLFPSILQNATRYELLKASQNWNYLCTNPEWDPLANSITSSDRLLIAGGKGVGKSTMCRYMLNKLLTRYPKVMLIDLDPGQPEFTLPGCVSISIVEEPIFGPNYTHLKTPFRCVFVSKINIFNSPHEYIQSVKKLLEENFPSMPTLINYMGFTRDLGLELFSAIAAYSKPTMVAYIHSQNNVRNFKTTLSYEEIVARAKLFADKVDFLYFPINILCSMADGNEGWNLLPREIREICVLTYLGSMVSKEDLSLINCNKFAYIVDLTMVKLLHNNEEVSPEVVNGSLLALCSNNGICYGWGVVRGINLAANDLYIQAPVSLKIFEKVECLILGSIMLPASLYMTSTNKPIPNPYVCFNPIDLLGKIPKRTHISVKQRFN